MRLAVISGRPEHLSLCPSIKHHFGTQSLVYLTLSEISYLLNIRSILIYSDSSYKLKSRSSLWYTLLPSASPSNEVRCYEHSPAVEIPISLQVPEKAPKLLPKGRKNHSFTNEERNIAASGPSVRTVSELKDAVCANLF